MALLQVQAVSDPNLSAVDMINKGSGGSLNSLNESFHSYMANTDSICARLDSVANHILSVAKYTDPDPLTYFSLHISVLATIIAIIGIGISIVATIYTFKGANFSEKTAENVVRMAGKTQMALLEDIVRHLYRNKVCTHALIAKMKDLEYKFYPSEEHFLKLAMLPEDIHMESYNKDPKIYTKMHGISLLLRNYNVEIEVIRKQLCNPGTLDEVRKHGEGSLIFKPYFLISKIAEVMEVLNEDDKKKNKKEKKEDQKQKVVEIILREHFCKLFDKFNVARYIPFAGDDREENLSEKEESLKVRYEKIKKEIIANGDNKRSLLTLTKRVTGGEVVSNNGEIKEDSEMNPEEYKALDIKSENVFDKPLRKKFIETKNKKENGNLLKAYLYNEIYSEDYTDLYLKEYSSEYREDETYEKTYQPLHLETNKTGKEQGVDFKLFDVEWDAFDMLHKALIKDVTIEYDVIRMIPYSEKTGKTEK